MFNQRKCFCSSKFTAVTDACASVIAVDFNHVQFCSKWFKSVSHCSLNNGEYVCGSCFIIFLFWSIFFLTFKEVNVHLPISWSQGTQGLQTFMSSRWSCRSCPLQGQCDLCSFNSPFVPRTSIPFKIEVYGTHHFMWHMKGNIHRGASLCAMVIDSDFQITLPTGAQAPRGSGPWCGGARRTAGQIENHQVTMLLWRAWLCWVAATLRNLPLDRKEPEYCRHNIEASHVNKCCSNKAAFNFKHILLKKIKAISSLGQYFWRNFIFHCCLWSPR